MKVHVDNPISLEIRQKATDTVLVRRKTGESVNEAFIHWYRNDGFQFNTVIEYINQMRDQGSMFVEVCYFNDLGSAIGYAVG